jgi:hypothetical protein
MGCCALSKHVGALEDDDVAAAIVAAKGNTSACDEPGSHRTVAPISNGSIHSKCKLQQFAHSHSTFDDHQRCAAATDTVSLNNNQEHCTDYISQSKTAAKQQKSAYNDITVSPTSTATTIHNDAIIAPLTTGMKAGAGAGADATTTNGKIDCIDENEEKEGDGGVGAGADGDRSPPFILPLNHDNQVYNSNCLDAQQATTSSLVLETPTTRTPQHASIPVSSLPPAPHSSVHNYGEDQYHQRLLLTPHSPGFTPSINGRRGFRVQDAYHMKHDRTVGVVQILHFGNKVPSFDIDKKVKKNVFS